MIGFPESWLRRRVTLSHDWLTGMRGGERVLEILCRGFPDAPVFTLIHNPGAVSPAINSHRIHASALQRIPGISSRYRLLLPLFPAAVRGLRPPTADLHISTSHCVAKAVRPGPGARHLCYCFTPMRYAWTFYEEYFGRNPLKALALKPILAALRSWDRAANTRVDRFVAISRHVRDRIRTFYGREADVVYPPVDTEKWTPSPAPPTADFDLIVSALVPYKRIDLAVRAYASSGYPLRIVGVGTESARLRALAAGNIRFLEWQSDEQVLDLYRNCRLLVFPGEEDFGIVPLEAQSAGRPVVAYARGGALETVADGTTGTLFGNQTERDLLDAVERAAATPWDRDTIRAHAEQFSIRHFVDGLEQSILKCLQSSA